MRCSLRHLFLSFVLVRFALAADWAPNLTATTTWQDNATNADRRTDVLGSLALSADLAASGRFALTASDGLTFGGRITGETFPRFDDLDHTTLGTEIGWLRKSGLGPQAPIFSTLLSTAAVFARDSARSGLAVTLMLSYRQRLGDATLVTLAQDFSRLDTRGAVYDRTGAETSLSVTQTLDESWRLGAVARLRFGDILSYGTPPRPDLVALARVRTPVNTFDRPMVAYSLTARTLTGGLSLTRLLDDRTSLILAAEYRATERAALRYVNRLVSATLAHQF